LFAGVLGAGVSFPLFLDFYDSDARGAWTLPSLLHLPYGTVVLLIAIVAILGFIGAEVIEKRANAARTTAAPAGARAKTGGRVRIAAVVLVLILSALAAIVRTPAAATKPRVGVAKSGLYKPPNGC
jgi:hypothetical protein